MEGGGATLSSGDLPISIGDSIVYYSGFRASPLNPLPCSNKSVVVTSCLLPHLYSHFAGFGRSSADRQALTSTEPRTTTFSFTRYAVPFRTSAYMALTPTSGRTAMTPPMWTGGFGARASQFSFSVDFLTGTRFATYSKGDPMYLGPVNFGQGMESSCLVLRASNAFSGLSRWPPPLYRQ